MAETIFTILTHIFTFGYSYYLKRKEKFLEESLKDNDKLYTILNEACIELNADRARLLCLHNGGGKIVPGAPKYITAIEEIDRNITPRINENIKRLADTSYLKKITSMYLAEEHTVIVKTEDLADGGLKRAHITDGIKLSVSTYIGSNSKYLWYISFNFKEEKNVELNVVAGCRTRMANILEKYFTLDHRN